MQPAPVRLAAAIHVAVFDATPLMCTAIFLEHPTISINPGFPNLSIDVWNSDGPLVTRGFTEQYFAQKRPAAAEAERPRPAPAARMASAF